jgi:hypothetical protein
MAKIECGIRFMVSYPPFPPEMSCELERYHEGPHLSTGFAWGPVDQSHDFQVDRMRKSEAARKDKVRGWHKLLRK